MQLSKNTHKNINSLNGLRGLAALLVIFSHTSLSGMYFIPGINMHGIGKYGVYLFFMLSAFLLALPFVRSESNPFSIQVAQRYWKRRFLRVYPLYIVYLTTGLATTFFISLVSVTKDIGIPFSLTIFEYLRHLMLLEGKSVTWSIAVEFKFYFILPVIVFLMNACRKIHIITPYFLLTLIIVISQILAPQADILTNDIRLTPYLVIFSIGLALAEFYVYIIRCEEATLSKLKPFLYIGSLFAIFLLIILAPAVWSSIFFEIPSDHFHKHIIQMSILWGIVMVTILTTSSIVTRFFEMKFLAFFGNLSFSIYLFHPVFIGIVKRLPTPNIADAWLVLLLSTITAYLSYRYFEKPLSKI